MVVKNSFAWCPSLWYYSELFTACPKKAEDTPPLFSNVGKICTRTLNNSLLLVFSWWRITLVALSCTKNCSSSHINQLWLSFHNCFTDNILTVNIGTCKIFLRNKEWDAICEVSFPICWTIKLSPSNNYFLGPFIWSCFCKQCDIKAHVMRCPCVQNPRISFNKFIWSLSIHCRKICLSR